MAQLAPLKRMTVSAPASRTGHDRPAPDVPPAVAALPFTPVADLLSTREREIAVLVAQGLSNKEIAIELGISPWTVSAHLRRVFTKLDIGRRIELCLLLMPAPLGRG